MIIDLKLTENSKYKTLFQKKIDEHIYKIY